MVIEYLNIFGMVAALVIYMSPYISQLQQVYFLIFVIIVLRAGFSSFVSLAFIEMEREGMNSLIVSGLFFWIANVTNLAGMELVDLIPVDISLGLLLMFVVVCFILARKYGNMVSLPI